MHFKGWRGWQRWRLNLYSCQRIASDQCICYFTIISQDCCWWSQEVDIKQDNRLTSKIEVRDRFLFFSFAFSFFVRPMTEDVFPASGWMSPKDSRQRQLPCTHCQSEGIILDLAVGRRQQSMIKVLVSQENKCRRNSWEDDVCSWSRSQRRREGEESAQKSAQKTAQKSTQSKMKGKESVKQEVAAQVTEQQKQNKKQSKEQQDTSNTSSNTSL